MTKTFEPWPLPQPGPPHWGGEDFLAQKRADLYASLIFADFYDALAVAEIDACANFDPMREPVALALFHGANVNALQMARQYRALPDGFRGYMDAFVARLWESVNDPEAARAVSWLDWFMAFTDDVGTGPDRDSEETRRAACECHGLTPGQFDRLLRAWDSIRAVFDEADKAVAEGGPTR